MHACACILACVGAHVSVLQDTHAQGRPVHYGALYKLRYDCRGDLKEGGAGGVMERKRIDKGK